MARKKLEEQKWKHVNRNEKTCVYILVNFVRKQEDTGKKGYLNLHLSSMSFSSGDCETICSNKASADFP